VDVRKYNIIYEAINDLKAALSGMLAPEIRELSLGRAQVRQIFSISKVGTISALRPEARSCAAPARGSGARRPVLGEGTISSLKRFKDDVREVLAGLECGLSSRASGVQVGDLVEAYTTEEVARTL